MCDKTQVPAGVGILYAQFRNLKVLNMQQDASLARVGIGILCAHLQEHLMCDKTQVRVRLAHLKKHAHATLQHTESFSAPMSRVRTKMWGKPTQQRSAEVNIHTRIRMTS